MNNNNILFCKDGFEFIKNTKNNYSLKFSMKNDNIILPKIIDFTLIELIYKLNNDIYEKINLEKINEEEAVLVLLLKHLFEDLGLPQRYTHVHIKKITKNNEIQFISEPILTGKPIGMPDDSEQLPIKNLTCICHFITNHNVTFTCNIIFEDGLNIPTYIEKMVGFILFKIFNRVKQFIENVRM